MRRPRCVEVACAARQHPLQVLKLTASDSQIGGWFGWSVAITEARIVLGPPQTLEIAGGAASVPRGEVLP
jgi:hypothetical protein